MSLDKTLVYALSLNKSLYDKYGGDPNFACHVTVASDAAKSSKPSYFQYISLTQRVSYGSNVVCYITYRLHRPSVSPVEPEFSSFEVFPNTFDQSLAVKFHIDDPSFGSTPRDREVMCTRLVYDHVCRMVDSILPTIH